MDIVMSLPIYYYVMTICQSGGCENGWRISYVCGWVENVFGDRRFVVYTDKCVLYRLGHTEGTCTRQHVHTRETNDI